MPLPNEHAGRVRDPEGFATIRRDNRLIKVAGGRNKPVGYLFGMQGGKAVLLSIRFPALSWTAAAAKKFATSLGARGFEAAEKKTSASIDGDHSYLAQPDDLELGRAAGPIEAGKSTSGKGDEPSQMFVKDAIKVGKWTHPGTGEKIDVTRDRLSHWADTIKSMMGKGVDIYVPNTHKGANLGYVRDAWVDDDRLVVKTEMIGKDAIRAASRNKVSVRICPKYTDGQGNEWKDAIDHVAVVPDPVITGQEPFVRVAASKGAAGHSLTPVLTMSRDDLEVIDPSAGATTMSKLTDLLADKLGITFEDVEDEGAVCEAVGAALGKQATAATTASKALSKSDSKVKELSRKLEDGKAQEMSASETALSKRALRSDLDGLVTKAKITPAVRDKLVTALGAHPSMLSVADGADDPAFADVVEALGDNDPVALGEKTAAQAIEAGRSAEGDDPYDEDVKNEMVAMAGGGMPENKKKSKKAAA